MDAGCPRLLQLKQHERRATVQQFQHRRIEHPARRSLLQQHGAPWLCALRLPSPSCCGVEPYADASADVNTNGYTNADCDADPDCHPEVYAQATSVSRARYGVAVTRACCYTCNGKYWLRSGRQDSHLVCQWTVSNSLALAN